MVTSFVILKAGKAGESDKAVFTGPMGQAWGTYIFAPDIQPRARDWFALQVAKIIDETNARFNTGEQGRIKAHRDASMKAAAADLFTSLDELVNSPNAKSNAMWDRARDAVARAKS